MNQNNFIKNIFDYSKDLIRLFSINTHALFIIRFRYFHSNYLKCLLMLPNYLKCESYKKIFSYLKNLHNKSIVYS